VSSACGHHLSWTHGLTLGIQFVLVNFFLNVKHPSLFSGASKTDKKSFVISKTENIFIQNKNDVFIFFGNSTLLLQGCN
jgi:hypothetical protein